MKRLLLRQLHVDKRKAGQQLGLGGRIARKTWPDQQDTIDVVGLRPVRDEDAVDDQPQRPSYLASSTSQCSDFNLHPAQLRFLIKAAGDFFQRRLVDACRQVAIVIEARDHAHFHHETTEPPLYPLSLGLASQQSTQE